MDILKPEDETLELLAMELGFVLFTEKNGSTKDTLMKEGINENNRAPAMIKPFTQLT